MRFLLYLLMSVIALPSYAWWWDSAPPMTFPNAVFAELNISLDYSLLVTAAEGCPLTASRSKECYGTETVQENIQVHSLNYCYKVSNMNYSSNPILNEGFRLIIYDENNNELLEDILRPLSVNAIETDSYIKIDANIFIQLPYVFSARYIEIIKITDRASPIVRIDLPYDARRYFRTTHFPDGHSITWDENTLCHSKKL